LRETVVTVCMCSPLLRRLLDFITDNIRPKNKSEILSSLGYQLCDRVFWCLKFFPQHVHDLIVLDKRIEDGEEKKLKMQITPSKKFIDGTKQIETKQEVCMISWVY
ncbi:hypothetical protein T4B_13682, partial [Trichinella pseudospiralis]